MRHTTASKYASVAAAGLLAAGLLAACDTGSDASEDGAAGGPTAAPDTSSSAPAGTSGSATGSAPPSGSATSGTAAADPAIAAVGAAVSGGGKAIEVDREETEEGFKVTVVEGGTAREVRIGPDGQPQGGEREEELDADERAQVDAATVELVEALETALGEAPDRVVDEAELDDRNDTVVWKVSLDLPDRPDDDQEVYVDAATGDVVQ